MGSYDENNPDHSKPDGPLLPHSNNIDQDPNFGFESLCENDYVVPDSLDYNAKEIEHDDLEPAYAVIEEVEDEKRATKGKKSKKSKAKTSVNTKRPLAKESKSTEKGKGKILKNCSSAKRVDDANSNYAKKAFTDVDDSLNELCTVDNVNKNDGKPNADVSNLQSEKAKIPKKSTEKNKLREEQQCLDNLYTFSDPPIEESRKVQKKPETSERDASSQDDSEHMPNKKTKGSKNKDATNDKKRHSKTKFKSSRKALDQADTGVEAANSSRSLRHRNNKHSSYKDIDESFVIEDIGSLSPDYISDINDSDNHLTADYIIPATEDVIAVCDEPVVEIEVDTSFEKTEINDDDHKSVSKDGDQKKPRRKSRVSFDLTERKGHVNDCKADVECIIANDINEPKSKKRKQAKKLKDVFKKDDKDSVIFDESDYNQSELFEDNITNTRTDSNTGRKKRLPVAQIMPRTASPTSNKSQNSPSDSLYIESDDEYNARRYMLDCVGNSGDRRKHWTKKERGVETEIKEEKVIDVEKYKGKERESTSRILKKADRRSQRKNYDETVNDEDESFEVLSDENFNVTKSMEKKGNKKSKFDSCLSDSASLQTSRSGQDKNMVFHVSYTKSRQTFGKSGSRMKRYSEQFSKRELSYDPYDFGAQCDNTSMESERIKRPETSNAYKKQKKQKEKQPKLKKVKEESLTDCAIVAVENLNDTLEQFPLNIRAEAALVQDKKTNKWYRNGKKGKGKVKEEEMESPEQIQV